MAAEAEKAAEVRVAARVVVWVAARVERKAANKGVWEAAEMVEAARVEVAMVEVLLVEVTREV